jgi:ribosomal protein L7/L12
MFSDDQRFRWNGSKWVSFDVSRQGGLPPVGAAAGGARSFIARPDQAKGQLIYKWPDRNIRKWSQVTVESDELAVFFREGIAKLVLPPGRWTLESSELPILGDFIDARTGGNLFLTELYFVSIREFPNLQFSGSIDNVVDPQSNIAVAMQAEGTYSLKVTDPRTLIIRIAGTRASDTMDATAGWVNGILMKVLRTEVVQEILAEGWPMLGIVQHSDEIEAKALARLKPHLETYGLSVVRFGDFLIELGRSDAETLKTFSKDIQYSKLAGGYSAYSVGKAIQGVGEGAAQGAGASSPALMGLGFGLGNLAQGSLISPPNSSPPSEVLRVRCEGCGQLADEAALFCSKCGTRLAPRVQMPIGGWVCQSCQYQNATDAAFCSRCGAKASHGRIGGGAATSPSEAAVEPSQQRMEFTVMLTAVGNDKIGVIKAVRGVTKMGLKEAKNLVDTAPQIVLLNVSRADAEMAVMQLTQSGGSAEIT